MANPNFIQGVDGSLIDISSPYPTGEEIMNVARIAGEWPEPPIVSEVEKARMRDPGLQGFRSVQITEQGLAISFPD